MKYIWLIASILLGASGQVLMKWGIETGKQTGNAVIAGLNMTALLQIGSGLASYALSSVFWLLALKRFPLSTAYPMVSMSYILVMALGYFLFNETISMQKWFGVAFISVGVLFIARA
ncbi:EamA family transporter [Paenibacillus sp. NPDC056579]|uniref:EamA family transporter n=1 Tax=unclassified Paenibacillus TaxID=185978 RepID=UPI001EF8ECC5|nr:EamA family transporter [Paenibacillus sp. H1-7]ULL13624.1 hypothetical protein DVH26_03660 [Paenibacillus sp. H1-7]